MRAVRALAMSAGLMACEAAVDDFPINPGGGGGASGSGAGDAAVDGDDGGTQLAGRVCLVSDLRAPTSGCATTGAQDLTVTLGTRTAMTAFDGSFTIDVPSGSNLVWRASGPAIVTSVMPFSPELVIPAVSIDRYDELLLANGILLIPGQGSLIASVIRGQASLADATALVEPAPQFATLYDGASATVWDLDATGARGTAWVTGIAEGAAVLRVTPARGTAQDAVVPVEDRAITFVTVEIP
jgi:hypothetical protein